MRRIWGGIVVGFWVSIFLLPNTGFGQEFKLKLADPYPIGHVMHEVGKSLIASIQQQTQNRVKVEHYPAEQLGKAKDMLYLCSQGLSDISYVHITYFAGQLPLNNVAVLPFYTTALEGTEIYSRLVAENAEIRQEFQKYGTRVLSAFITNQYDIGTIKKAVINPGDAKGLKLKTAGGMYDHIAKRYGIIPVNVAAAETYEAMQRGVVEGCIFSYPSLKGYRLNELLKYITSGLRMGGYPQVYVINEKPWQKLPPDIQTAILKATQKNALFSPGDAWHREQMQLVEKFEKEGIAIHRIPPDQRGIWEAPIQGIEEIWLQDMEKKKLPGKKVFADFLKISKEIGK
ncbi:MAG: TRAP transporter substrate-binding protein DctP [Deltaproteobacteria bacterium]|nr:TRAP transporter substrate-binding protein DctP [Deltaproteobacteria bacterium]